MRLWEKITVEHITAAGILFAAGTFGLACLQYWHLGNEEHLQRALSLIEKVNTEAPLPLDEKDKWKAIDANRALVSAFPDRFLGKPIPSKPLDDSVAQDLLNVAIKPILNASDRELYEKWDAARRHLNNLEIFAFAYVYDFADRRLLAASSCGPMVRSNTYFSALIRAFKDKVGVAQSWQVIPKAVAMMEHDFGAGCENIYSAQAQ